MNAAPKRDRYGRYLIDGKPHTRATTIAKTLSDTYGLTQWKLRTALHGLTKRQDLYQLAATSDPDKDRKQLNQIAEQALEEGGATYRRNLGTAIHAATEHIDRGETPPAIGIETELDAYQQTIADHGFDLTRHIETVVVNTTLGYAGTADRIAHSPATGRNYIFDLKTGRTVDYSGGEFAIQFALYAHAEYSYDYETETKSDLPDIDKKRAIACHLPAGEGTCTLYSVDIEAGWEAVQQALWVRDWRKRSKQLLTEMT